MIGIISKQIKYQIVRVTVPAAGAIVNINVNTDKLYKKITGILVTLPHMVTFLNRSALNILVNDKEIFPDDFEVKLITCDSYVPTNERFYLLDEIADGSTVKGKFKDGADAGVVYPYTANIYLKLEERV
jgi:hypothetical protein